MMEFSTQGKDNTSGGKSDKKILKKKKEQKQRTKNNRKVLSFVFPYLSWDDLLTCRLVSKSWNTEARQQMSNAEHPMLKFRFSPGSQSYLAQFEDGKDKIILKRNRSLSKFMECFFNSSSSSSANNFLPYNNFGFFGGNWDTADLRKFRDQYGSNVKTLELGFDNNNYCMLHGPVMPTLWDILSLNVPNLSHLILDQPPTHWQNQAILHHHFEISLPALKTIEIEEFKSYKNHSDIIMTLLAAAPNLENFVNFQFSLLDPFIQANKIGFIKTLEVTHPTYLSEDLWNLQKYFTVWKNFLDCGQPLKLKKIVVIPDESFSCDNEKIKSEFARMLKQILKSSKDTLEELAMYPVPGVLDEGSVPVLYKLKTLKLYEFDLCIKGEINQNILVKGSRLAKMMPNLSKVELFATDYYHLYEHEDGNRFFDPGNEMRPTTCSGGCMHKRVTGVFTIDSDSDMEEEKSSYPEEDAGFFPPSLTRLDLTLTLMETKAQPKKYEMRPLLRNLSRLFINVSSLKVRTCSYFDSLAETLKAVCVGWKNLEILEVGALDFDVGERIPGKTWNKKEMFDDCDEFAQPIDLDKLRREWPLSSLKNLRSLDIGPALASWENCPGYRLNGPDNFHICQAVGERPSGEAMVVPNNSVYLLAGGPGPFTSLFTSRI